MKPIYRSDEKQEHKTIHVHNLRIFLEIIEKVTNFEKRKKSFFFVTLTLTNYITKICIKMCKF